MKNDQPKRFSGKTLDELDQLWAPVKGNLRERRTELNGMIGLYRVRLDGREKAIGRAIEVNGGLAKRLHDFGRPSDNARKHKAGQLIHQHIDQIDVQVLITNDLSTNPRKLAKDLRGPMIDRHKPEWTVRAQQRNGKKAKKAGRTSGEVKQASPYTGTVPKIVR